MKKWILLFLFLAGCQTAPTKTQETTKNVPVAKTGELVITPETVILDARPLFSYSNGHLPTALPIRWQDFSKPGARDPGPLDSDTFAIARRLARMGITPETKVVVLGMGKDGQGEEGRIAWMLSYLGVKDARFAKEDFFQGKRIVGDPAAVKNAPIWKPALQDDLLTAQDEWRRALAHNQKRPGERIWIIDVRTPEEYLRRSGEADVGAINIEWREFINEMGRPRSEIVPQIEALGLTRDQQVIVTGPMGVTSALVTMALRELGYSKVSNHIPTSRAK